MDNQDKNTNEIRDLLRKKLSDQQPAENGWNVPSNKVWDSLSDDLHLETRSDKGIWQRYLFLAVVAALLTILLLQECSHREQVVKLQSEVHQLKDSFTELQEACEEKHIEQQNQNLNNQDLGITHDPSGENTASNFKQTEKSTPVDQMAAGESIIFKNRTKVSDVSAKAANNYFPDRQQEQFAMGVDPPQATDLMAIPAKPLPPFFEENQKAPGPHFLEKKTNATGLPSLPLNALDYPVSLPFVDLNIPITSTPTISKVALLATLYSGISLTGNHLTGEQPAIIADQKSLFAFRTGVGLEARFNRQWSVGMGLHYATSNVQTVYQLAVPFTNNGEFQHDDGNFDNEYNHSLPSSLGNYPAQLVLTRESTATVEEGEVMNLDLTIRQRMRFLSVPVTLRYGFGKNPVVPVQFGINMGIIGNRTLGISSEASSLVSHHGAIHQRHTSIGNPVYDDLQKVTLDYSLGLDARYFLAPNMSLTLEANYQRGITPIYQDEMVKNYLRAWNAGVGLQVVF
jgi:hypothetical protein